MVLNIFLCSLKHFRLFVFYLLLLPSDLAKKIYSMVVPLSTTFLLLVFLVASTVANNPRIFRISASSLYVAGFKHGTLAKDLIRSAFQLPEFETMRAFVSKSEVGKTAFARLIKDNTIQFPGLVEEMLGTAAGAAVPVEDIWMANLVTEIESLMKEEKAHCSDIYAARREDGTVSHGHNEDWSSTLKPYWYILSLTALPGSNFSSCGGMAYPGTMVGFAATWNAHGVYSTQNTLFPRPTRGYGLASTLAQRIANCGPIGKGPFNIVDNIDEFSTLLHTKNWAASASLNVVDLNHQKMANIEVYEDGYSRYDVQGNYSHFNMFKHLKIGIQHDEGDNSTRHRQKRVNELPPPSTTHDIRNILGDTQDQAYPIYRDITLSTLVLNGKTKTLEVWIDQNPSLPSSDPFFSFHLPTFFTTTGTNEEQEDPS